MAKDPAFLFYYQDFLVGTDDMTNEEIGAYIRCLCNQASKGSINEKHMFKICLTQDVFDAVKSKFVQDTDGTFYNLRLREEIEKRKAYGESRRNNRKVKTHEKDMKNISSTYDSDMKNISKTYVQHMENENISSIYSLEENRKYNLAYCAEVASKDQRWMKLNKADLPQLQTFSEYLESIGEHEKTLLEFKKHFAHKKRKSPEMFTQSTNNQFKTMLDAIAKKHSERS